jgi:DNA-directed RNA polymerase subunit alpha
MQFSPVRRVHEVENMRVGDKTNHNRLRIGIETDGTIDPREALEQSISIMIEQLQAVVDFKPTHVPSETTSSPEVSDEKDSKEDMSDAMKTRIDTLYLSTRTMNALQAANIRTVGGIARKKVEDLLEVEGIGDKGIEEIKDVLKNFGISLKD